MYPHIQTHIWGFRECGEDSKQIRMQTVRQEEYIKANRLERTASTWPYRRPAARVGFHFQHSSQYAKCSIFPMEVK